MDENIKMRIMELRETLKEADITIMTDQEEGLPQPPLAKASIGSKIISLSRNFENIIQNNDFMNIINSRTSKRNYSEEALSIDELSFLLWSCQGVKNVIGKQRKATMRTVPSAGARHPFETYLLVNRVEGLEQGLYHYLSLEHKLEYISSIDNQIDRVSEAFCGQTFYANAAVDFIWTAVPYRCEWRYSFNAHKYILLDAGHVCQNLYLASEAIGCGTCAIGAYEQKLADQLLGFDSEPSGEENNEFIVYAASVGKIAKEK